jgi:hypothetical protein
VSQESLTATELDPSKHLHQKRTTLRGFEVFQAMKNIRSKATLKAFAKTARGNPLIVAPPVLTHFERSWFSHSLPNEVTPSRKPHGRKVAGEQPRFRVVPPS